jgi:hypothetical protein
MARHKDMDWNLAEGTPQPGGSKTHTWDSIHTALLMDIRDELKRINSRLDCRETQLIPRYLKRIAANTARPKKKT